MEDTLQECSNEMLMQLVIGVILILINVVLLIAVGAGAFILKRVLKAVDELPSQFAKVHARISAGERIDAEQGVRIEQLEGQRRRP